MTPTPHKLTLAPYLQRFDADKNILIINLLVMPIGSPFVPLGEGLAGVTDKGPAFIDAEFQFDVRISQNWQQLPEVAHFDFQQNLTPMMPDNREAICQELANQFNITQSEEVIERKAELMIRKHLMKTYTESFNFVSPKTKLASTDDTYACLLNCPPKDPPSDGVPDDSISWAEAFSFVLRQPKLAKELGLIYTLEVSLPDADLLKNGGWIFVTLAGMSSYGDLVSTPNFLKMLGSRIPRLTASRPLFTPVLFPVSVGAPIVGDFADAFLEFFQFNDGFAKIVHSGQAKNRNHLIEEEVPGASPMREEGIQLGWDDEDIVIAQNRQMGLDPDTMTEPAEAPLGVVGYRVDVRKLGDTDWSSLSKVAADNFRFAGLDFGAFAWESRVEVFPASIEEQFWLPSYFARWKGGSLVVIDDDDLLLLTGESRPTPLYYQSVDADEVPLRYGQKYEFRVRMVDTTNGGPVLEDHALVPGDAPTSQVHFKRFIPPGAVAWPETDMNPRNATVMTYNISRPQIGLPEALYVNQPNVRDLLFNMQKDNLGKAAEDAQEATIFDPDTPTLGIRVLVRVPDFDPTAVDVDEEGFVEWYSTSRLFPDSPDSPYQLQLEFVDNPQLSAIDISAQLADTPVGKLVLPTARDIKIELRAIGLDDLDYFGSELARQGATSVLKLRKVATNEANFFLPQTPQDTLRSVYLQPTDLENEQQPTATVLQNEALPVLVQRLAGATGLVANDNTLLMPPGQRGIFGCSKELKHYMPANNSSLVLMAIGELPQQWINVLQWKINRDWTWNGYGGPTFELQRLISLNGNSFTKQESVGKIRMSHAVTPLLDEEMAAETDSFNLVFLDAFQAPTGTDGLPYEIKTSYKLTVHFENGSSEELIIGNDLPITAKPKQIPQVVSAGIALSPYVIGEGYSSTATRRRMLWFEFNEPPADSRDNYFVRVLAQTADPMLLQHYQSLEEPPGYRQWSLDPELIRVILPGQADDSAGLSAMQRLIPAQDSDRHFLVPLPPGTYPDSPELFGFYTYEIRVGHDKGSPSNPFWSTAQARFGPPTLLEGVQHPCPSLTCNLYRVKNGILVSSTYAKPFHKGLDLQATPPNTEIYHILYAQVHQADGSSMRNIELDKKQAIRLTRQLYGTYKQVTGIQLEQEFCAGDEAAYSGASNKLNTPIQAHCLWQQKEVETLLREVGLPVDTPLSVLGIELLPEPTGDFADPLGGNLGQVRILRTSPLYPVSNLCC